MRIYLDHNATTPLAPSVARAIAEALQVWGNPSSIHEEGRTARALVEDARLHVAALLSADPAEVVFTSGGTEADALGIVGLARAARAAGAPPVVLTAAVEHPAVLGAAEGLAREGFDIQMLPVDDCGRIDPDEVERRCAGGAAVLAVSVANHELGTLQDVAALADRARAAGVLVHCDAVQAAGKVKLDVAALGADAVAVSAHKIYGPKGAGALWVSGRIDLGPLWPGGHQERDRRPGTENVAAIAGFGEAARLARERRADGAAALARLTEQLEAGLRRIEGARIHGDGAPRVPGTVNAAFAGALGEVVVVALDLEGVAASTGAACTSGAVQPSPVLLATGLSRDRAAEAVRFGLGRGNDPDQVEALLELLPPIIARARRFR